MVRLFDNPLHLVLLLAVILIIFGAGKLPGVGAALGQSVKEFKREATNEPDAPAQASVAQVAAAPQPAVQPSTCAICSTTIPATAKFCPSCGAAVGAAAPQAKV